jgi:hypothetical protein
MCMHASKGGLVPGQAYQLSLSFQPLMAALLVALQQGAHWDSATTNKVQEPS